jgi:hypothetical protein
MYHYERGWARIDLEAGEIKTKNTQRSLREKLLGKCTVIRASVAMDFLATNAQISINATSPSGDVTGKK